MITNKLTLLSKSGRNQRKPRVRVINRKQRRKGDRDDESSVKHSSMKVCDGEAGLLCLRVHPCWFEEGTGGIEHLFAYVETQLRYVS